MLEQAAGPGWTCTSKRGILGHHLTLALAGYTPGLATPRQSRGQYVLKGFEGKKHLWLLRKPSAGTPPVHISAANPF